MLPYNREKIMEKHIEENKNGEKTSNNGMMYAESRRKKRNRKCVCVNNLSSVHELQMPYYLILG